MNAKKNELRALLLEAGYSGEFSLYKARPVPEATEEDLWQTTENYVAFQFGGEWYTAEWETSSGFHSENLGAGGFLLCIEDPYDMPARLFEYICTVTVEPLEEPEVTQDDIGALSTGLPEGTWTVCWRDPLQGGKVIPGVFAYTAVNNKWCYRKSPKGCGYGSYSDVRLRNLCVVRGAPPEGFEYVATITTSKDERTRRVHEAFWAPYVGKYAVICGVHYKVEAVLDAYAASPQVGELVVRRAGTKAFPLCVGMGDRAAASMPIEVSGVPPSLLVEGDARRIDCRTRQAYKKVVRAGSHGTTYLVGQLGDRNVLLALNSDGLPSGNVYPTECDNGSWDPSSVILVANNLREYIGGAE